MIETFDGEVFSEDEYEAVHDIMDATIDGILDDCDNKFLALPVVLCEGMVTTLLALEPEYPKIALATLFRYALGLSGKFNRTLH